MISWDKHINRSTKKANQTLGFLRRNVKVNSESLKAMAYKTLVRPQLEYASEVWFPHSQTQIDQIEAIQRRSVRWVKSDFGRTSSVTQMMQSLNWRRLDLRRIDCRLSMMYKITNDLVAIPSEGYLTPLGRASRHAHLLSYRLIPAQTDYHKFSFFPRTVFHWNNLSPDIVTLPTLNQFNMAVSHIDHISP